VFFSPFVGGFGFVLFFIMADCATERIKDIDSDFEYRKGDKSRWRELESRISASCKSRGLHEDTSCSEEN